MPESQPNTDPDDAEELQIIFPTEEEAAEGRAQLEECLAHWRTAPGLLIIKPELAVIVSVRDCSWDDVGFTLQLQTEEPLMAPQSGVADELKVSCSWNQPYMSFDKDCIAAPYSFVLHFAAGGMALVRQYQSTLLQIAKVDAFANASVFNWCFERNGAEAMERLRRTALKDSDEEVSD